MPIIYNKNALRHYLGPVLSDEEYPQLESLEFEKNENDKAKDFQL